MVLILVGSLVLAYYILTYDADPAEGPSAEEIVDNWDTLQPDGEATVQLVTWNLYNFGRSKDEHEMQFIAQQIRPFELVAIQEVSTGQAGAEAVARLDAVLDRMGTQWDYLISEPTKGDGPERYAYLWQTSRIQALDRGWLATSIAQQVDREPFLARFEVKGTGRRFLVASFHAVPTSKKPAEEIAFLDELHQRYASDDMIILGDFNLSEGHYAFDELKHIGYRPALVDQRTSIRMKVRDGQHLANEYDNIFYEAGPLRANRVGVVDFTGQFPTLREARRISDHLPVYMELAWN